MIKEPFAVINCDDFYGRDSFQVMGKFLSALPADSKNVHQWNKEFALQVFHVFRVAQESLEEFLTVSEVVQNRINQRQK
mgnify:CR=1 FL=1